MATNLTIKPLYLFPILGYLAVNHACLASTFSDDISQSINQGFNQSLNQAVTENPLFCLHQQPYTKSHSSSERLYLIAGLGTSANTDLDILSSIDNYPVMSNESDYMSYRLGMGFIYPATIHTSFGLEAAYNYYGSQQYYYWDGDSDKVTFSAVDILAVLGYKLTPNWSIKLRTGIAYETVRTSEEIYGEDLSESEWIPEIGIGLSYRINDYIGVETSFSYLLGNVSDINTMPDITVAWLTTNIYL